MRWFLIFSIICLRTLIASQALRLRGEKYPGLRNVNTKVNITRMYQQITPRIAGGETAVEAFAPWQVSLQNQYGNHFCGGAIIADQYVVTAASCVAGLDKRNVRVICGTNNWMALASEYYVEEIIIHCSFDQPLYHNDLALIKLKKSIKYDDKTKNITLAELDELEEGETLTLTGWGSKKLGEPYPVKLRKLDAVSIDTEKCRRMYGQYADNVDVGHLCILSPKGNGACHGDTGGPLVNSKGQLVGIGNWGVPCGEGFPDVFAKLSFYNDWIRTTINGCMMP